MTVIDMPKRKHSGRYKTEFIGPFTEEWAVTYDGYRVPNLKAVVQENGNVMLILDGRFLKEAPQEEAEQWIPFIADAMAIAAGYSCFGENSVKEPNPFKVGMIGLGGKP